MDERELFVNLAFILHLHLAWCFGGGKLQQVWRFYSKIDLNDLVLG
jgi:hypothetical protein